ncbi:DNA polymerase III subunit gamma/tau [uncultured Prevotella sp.]|uniref:DNA polymerase III subunit gamma/tau n=1 Tax=uncultured Prevotella sp. TaxID=159272 RepID=UPI0027E3804C|nr:DNA polymerase III subunit gamma/tau [uncultured Prevotella sp.]
MEEYIVSARKYRPMSFDSVVGQNALTTTLRNAVKSGKLAHAYLFCGPRGVGKTTCARIFAKAINCLNPTADGEACGQCESCRAFSEQRSYNIFELDAASNNSVENIKQIMEQTRIPPQVGRYKVFIIDEVHMLSTAAFNAFLKTLEEPPAHVIFILATTEKHKILPTILSRCQIYDFERMTVENTIAHLKHVADKEGIKYEEEALGIIAEKADGGMRDALSIFDQAASFCQGNITYQKVIEDLNELDANNYFRIVDLAMENKVSDIMLLLNSIIEKGFDGGNLINGLASHVRNVLMAKDASTLTLLEVSKQQRDKYAEQAQRCPTRFLYTALKIMNQCDLNYRQSSNKRLLVELTLIQVAQITQPEDTADGAGRSPKRLKSLFIHLTTARNTAAQQVATPGKNLGYGTNKTGTAALSVVSNDTEALSQAMTAAANTITSAASLASAQTDNKPKPKAIKLSGLGITFQSLKRKQEAAVKQEAEITNKEENEEFTQELLELQWLSMCNRMPQKMIALASRMKNVKPHISNFPEIEIVVDNQILLDQINEIKGRIRVTLAKALHNGSVNLTLRLAEAEEISRKLTKKEVFDELMKQKEVRSFVESMGLELT